MNEKTLPPEMYRLPSNLMPLDATELSDQQNLNLMINIWIFYCFIYLNIIIWIFFFLWINYLLNRVRIFTSGITYTLKLVISFSDSVISFFLYSSTSLDLFFFLLFFILIHLNILNVCQLMHHIQRILIFFDILFLFFNILLIYLIFFVLFEIILIQIFIFNYLKKFRKIKKIKI